jgi:hypothetical protein
VRGRIAALLARLRHAPDAPVPGVLDYPTARAVIFSSLYAVGGWPQLAAGLAAAEQGDGSLLLSGPAGPRVGPGRAAGAAGSYDNFLDAQTGILCTDSPAPRDPGRWPALVHRLERISAIGGPLLGWGTLGCASWPARAADRYTGPWRAPTSHPVLLVGVTHDRSRRWPARGGWPG